MTITQSRPEGTASIVRRVGTPPRDRKGMKCGSTVDCPDVFLLDSGDYVIIGRDVSSSISLPEDAGCSANERVVEVPREVMLAAFRDILDSGDLNVATPRRSQPCELSLLVDGINYLIKFNLGWLSDLHQLTRRHMPPPVFPYEGTGE